MFCFMFQRGGKKMNLKVKTIQMSVVIRVGLNTAIHQH